MSSRIAGISLPLLLAGAAVLAVIIGAAVALALDSGGDSSPDPPEATPTATMPAATTAPTSTPPAPTQTPAAPTPVPPTPTVEAAETWSIDFELTGGIAGLAQRMRITSDGQATYEDLRDQRVEPGTISATDLAELRALIDSADFFSQPSPQGPPCPDCFNLSITVTVEGRTHTVLGGDFSLDDALKPLADRLGALLQDGLAP
jgi:hypothetical protein